MFFTVSNKPPNISKTSIITTISPASVAKVAISSLSLFLSKTTIIAVKNPTPAIFKIMPTSILPPTYTTITNKAMPKSTHNLKYILPSRFSSSAVLTSKL